MNTKRSLVDWSTFGLLSLLWASAYAFNRMAVSKGAPELGFPPQLVILGRLSIAAVVLLIIVALTRQKWPAFSDRKSWLAMAAMGLLGCAIPFYLIAAAQKTVDSSLAALYVSASPLFVSIMAHFIFHDERISTRKVIGLLIGFGGVTVLFGPEAFAAFGSSSVIAQAMCLFATSMYAASTIIARYARDIPPFVFSAGFLTIGTLLSLPLLVTVDISALAPSSTAMFGIVGLALGPTALASILYMVLVARTSATFLSLTGYVIPILSAIIGFFAFQEMQSPRAVLAFAMILGGVWLAQRASLPRG